MYLEEGAAEGVRGDFAFAQAVVETGGFSAANDNNYSGLGWCDGCARGIVFPTPRDGIRGQIQLLLNYADSGSRAANLHNPLSPYVWRSVPPRSTPTSPRAGRRRGATWATATGPPTRTTRAR